LLPHWAVFVINKVIVHTALPTEMRLCKMRFSARTFIRVPANYVSGTAAPIAVPKLVVFLFCVATPARTQGVRAHCVPILTALLALVLFFCVVAPAWARRRSLASVCHRCKKVFNFRFSVLPVPFGCVPATARTLAALCAA
jgi:hypothetical protein